MEQMSLLMKAIISIDSFCAYAKLRLSKFKGIKRQNFIFHLKECEFRFDNRDKKGAKLYKILLKMIRENPLSVNCPFEILEFLSFSYFVMLKDFCL